MNGMHAPAVANPNRALLAITAAEIFVFAERERAEEVQCAFERAMLHLQPVPASRGTAQLHEGSASINLIDYLCGWNQIGNTGLRPLAHVTLPDLTFGIELELGGE